MAARRADAEIGLRRHATNFVLVNGLLLAINLITNAHSLWVKWPVFFWGVGLAIHAVSVYRIVHEESREAVIARKLRDLQPPDRSPS